MQFAKIERDNFKLKKELSLKYLKNLRDLQVGLREVLKVQKDQIAKIDLFIPAPAEVSSKVRLLRYR